MSLFINLIDFKLVQFIAKYGHYIRFPLVICTLANNTGNTVTFENYEERCHSKPTKMYSYWHYHTYFWHVQKAWTNNCWLFYTQATYVFKVKVWNAVLLMFSCIRHKLMSKYWNIGFAKCQTLSLYTVAWPFFYQHPSL